MGLDVASKSKHILPWLISKKKKKHMCAINI